MSVANGECAVAEHIIKYNEDIYVAFPEVISKVRADAIAECIDVLNDSVPFDCNSDFICGFYTAIEKLEQLKEQKDE